MNPLKEPHQAEARNKEKRPQEDSLKLKHNDATRKSEDRRLCAQPPVQRISLPETISEDRKYSIYLTNKKWLSGTVLHYAFVEHPTLWSWEESQKKIIRHAFETWKAIGIGLSFEETDDLHEAEIKIGFEPGSSWSYVGTDCLHNSDLGRTMNFGWDLRSDWGGATALHEIGHALGFEHEHQNPDSGISWNVPAVMAYYRGYPNYWDDQTIERNILSKIVSGKKRGSKWDPTSNLHYPQLPGHLLGPPPYDVEGIGENLALSQQDKLSALEMYPPVGHPRSIQVMRLEPLPTEAGSQTSFSFSPKATRKYRIQTVGSSDSRLVIFEERDGQPRHHSSADDSGRPENAMLETKLIAGRTYIIGVRTNYASSADGVGLLIS